VWSRSTTLIRCSAAKNVIVDLLAAHGAPGRKVDPQIRRVPPSSLELTFKIDEGPKVKVGESHCGGQHGVQR